MGRNPQFVYRVLSVPAVKVSRKLSGSCPRASNWILDRTWYIRSSVSPTYRKRRCLQESNEPCYASVLIGYSLLSRESCYRISMLTALPSNELTTYAYPYLMPIANDGNN